MSEVAGGSIYKEPVPQAEIDRLKAFTFPDRVSLRLLEPFLQDRTRPYSMVDVGAGSNATLAIEVLSAPKAEGVIPNEIVLVDTQTKMLAALREQLEAKGFPYVGVEGDATDLPLP